MLFLLAEDTWGFRGFGSQTLLYLAITGECAKLLGSTGRYSGALWKVLSLCWRHSLWGDSKYWKLLKSPWLKHFMHLWKADMEHILWVLKTWNHRSFRILNGSMCLLGAVEDTEAEICRDAPSVLWKICRLRVWPGWNDSLLSIGPFQNASRNRTCRNISGMQAWSWRTSKTRGLGQMMNAKTLST